MRARLSFLLSLLLLDGGPGAGRAAPAAKASPTPASKTASAWHIVQMDQRRYVPISDVAAFYRMRLAASDAKGFRLTSANRVIEGKAGSTEVRINGVKYVTCFPLRSRDDRVYLSAMDVTKIIEPLMRPGKIQGARPIRTIVLDAGHGGHDSGAVGPYGREKDYTLDVVLRARALLLTGGFQVKLTRASDVFIPLEERAAFANRFADALFVSVHFNKSNTGGTGIETYALAPRGVPSMDEGSLRYSDFRQNPGNARDAENIALAAAIHSMLVRNLPLPDRGIKRARFVVIKNLTIPGVLIEGGFVDNALDSRYIAVPAYRQRIAQSILDAATGYARTINGAAPRPTGVITAGPTPTPPPSLEEAIAAISSPPADSGPALAISPVAPGRRSTERPVAAPAFNPANPAFGRPAPPFDAWTFPPRALPFSTVNPVAAPEATPAPPPSPRERPARPNRDFPRRAAAGAKPDDNSAEP